MKARLSDRRINVQQGIEGFEVFRVDIRDQGSFTGGGEILR